MKYHNRSAITSREEEKENILIVLKNQKKANTEKTPILITLAPKNTKFAHRRLIKFKDGDLPVNIKKKSSKRTLKKKYLLILIQKNMDTASYGRNKQKKNNLID